ncbi:cytochrome P450 [Stereum hirsutum FP-91666 SS1]|uniref:cytochrome P450 n=1 Tax=Stereum hirsutum (strain FP-91666) TaxID=721885 RepID=UPI0004449AD6|nr:cytochrome P450 [Stereum hirsutum FP-91666 SS1]EIM80543.1 cytochrome P450 [Stereum hirsutum FP-91666 SS1]
MRWGVILPMGVPHQATSDEVHKGYHIPQGALVMANSWSILHNSEIYPDPEVFRPERCFGDGCKDYSDFAFGYGRRVCPGRWFATEAVWAAIVSILASFDIVSSMDEQGKLKPVTVDCTAGAVSIPVPFDFDLRVRSPSMKELLAGL